jgi:uncharacterized protein YndB with AHSA1/START domain
MADILHRIGIDSSSSKIYEALTTNEGLSRWWTADTRGAGDVGSVIEFWFAATCVRFELVELQPGSVVRWRHTGDTPAGWMGTEVSFHLQTDDRQTIVLFAHANWREPSDFMAHCSTKWATFLMSLKNAIETGHGSPFPDDVHIDHDE